MNMSYCIGWVIGVLTVLVYLHFANKNLPPKRYHVMVCAKDSEQSLISEAYFNDGPGTVETLSTITILEELEQYMPTPKILK